MASTPYASDFLQIFEAVKGFRVPVGKIYETLHECSLELKSHPRFALMNDDQKECFIESQLTKKIFGIIWEFPGSLEPLEQLAKQDARPQMPRSQAQEKAPKNEIEGASASPKAAENHPLVTDETFARALIQRYMANKAIINADKIVGDPEEDQQLLDELIPVENGRIKYSHQCKVCNEVFISLAAFPGTLARVQKILNVEIVIDYNPGISLVVHFKPLNMLTALNNKPGADWDLSHASRVMSFHLWFVDRELSQGRPFYGLCYSREKLLKRGKEFTEWIVDSVDD